MGRNPEVWREAAALPAALLVAIIAPEMLRWTLGAKTLARSPLRDRLEAICRRPGFGIAIFLLWQTDLFHGECRRYGDYSADTLHPLVRSAAGIDE